MTPATRKRLVRSWRRFVAAYEDANQTLDGYDLVTIGDVLMAEPIITRLNRARALYLGHLVGAGLLDGYRQCPDDDSLWEVHPVNVASSKGEDLYP